MLPKWSEDVSVDVSLEGGKHTQVIVHYEPALSKPSSDVQCKRTHMLSHQESKKSSQKLS